MKLKKFFEKKSKTEKNDIENKQENDAYKGNQKEIPGFFSFLRANWNNVNKVNEIKTKEILNSDIPIKNPGLWGRFRKIYKSYQDVKQTEVGRLQIYESIANQAELTKEFMVLLAGSTIIATFGLLGGSTAVIIGAMLIAPLMMPILGFSLGSIWGDTGLIKNSLVTLLVGSAFSFFIAFILSSIIPGNEMNSEILARTNPNIFDIIIAIASGLVGAYAYINPNISASISGVAIAVALMPPLCTIGISLGRFDFAAALGATILYVINLVGISLAASFVFWRMKVHPVMEDQTELKERAQRNVLLSTLILIVIAVPLGYFMVQTYIIKKNKNEISQLIQNSLPGVEIMSLDLDRERNKYRLKSVFIVSKDIPQKKLDSLRMNINQILDHKVDMLLIPLAAHTPIKENPNIKELPQIITPKKNEENALEKGSVPLNNQKSKNPNKN